MKRVGVALLVVGAVVALWVACPIAYLAMFGYDDSGLPPRPTLEAWQTESARAAAGTRIAAFAHSPIKPLGPPLTIPDGQLSQLAFSPDGKTLAALNGSSIVLWDLSTREPIGTLASPEGAGLDSLAFSADGAALAASTCRAVQPDSGCTGAILFWDMAARQLLGQPIDVQTSRLTALTFSPNGALLAAVDQDGTFNLWDAERLLGGTQPDSLPLAGLDGKVFSAAFSGDGRRLALGGVGGVSVWDTADAPSSIKPLGSLFSDPQRAGSIGFVAFGSDDDLIAADPDAYYYFWSVASRLQLNERTSHNGGALAFSPARPLLAGGQDDDSVILIDVWRGALVVPLSDSPSDSPVASLAFSPDGAVLAAVHQRVSIVLLDTSAAVTGVAFGPTPAPASEALPEAETPEPAHTRPVGVPVEPSRTPPSIAGLTRPENCQGDPVAFEYGIRDDFALTNGREPPPSNDLHLELVRLNGGSTARPEIRNFDEVGPDQWFAIRFSPLHQARWPTPICAAALEAGLRPGNADDSIAILFLTGSGGLPGGYPAGAAWWRRLGNGDGQAALFDFSWAEGGPDGHLLLNLAALPAADGRTLNLVDAINEYGFLDVVIENDTAVDYMTLTLWHAQ